MKWDGDWDIVAIGRIVGVLIIVAGIALAFWDAFDIPNTVSGDFQARIFLNGVLRWASSGFLIILAAGIAHRLRLVGDEAAEEGGSDEP